MSGVLVRRRRARSRAVWAPEIVAAVVAMGAGGAKQKVIARELGVSQAHVSRILSAHGGAR